MRFYCLNHTKLFKNKQTIQAKHIPTLFCTALHCGGKLQYLRGAGQKSPFVFQQKALVIFYLCIVKYLLCVHKIIRTANSTHNRDALQKFHIQKFAAQKGCSLLYVFGKRNLLRHMLVENKCINCIVVNFKIFAAYGSADKAQDKLLFFILLIVIAIAQADFVNAFKHHRNRQHNVGYTNAKHPKPHARNTGKQQVPRAFAVCGF